ncbi:MAG: EAL domain-containing protein [bacterium]
MNGSDTNLTAIAVFVAILAEELIDAARSFSFPWEERRLKIGLSVGAKVIDSDVASEIDVLVAAGASCAAAKESGRNRVNFHYRAKEIALRKSMGEWIPRISEALEENRFQIYCQPIVPVRPDDEESRHFEILVRMLDAQGQLVLPGKFIPPAEHYGLIEDIDKWVLNYVFDYQARRMREGLPLTKFAINLSGKSIGDETLSEHILSNFEATGLDPHLFQFEITETAAIRNFDRAMELIRTLKTAGCYFALDDFGSGLSSFGYLKELPVDYLKIDGSFIRNMESNDVDYSMVSTINHLGHIMGIETIAECVENKAQLAMLKKIGVDYVQGHLFSEPRPIDEFS